MSGPSIGRRRQRGQAIRPSAARREGYLSFKRIACLDELLVQGTGDCFDEGGFKHMRHGLRAPHLACVAIRDTANGG